MESILRICMNTEKTKIVDFKVHDIVYSFSLLNKLFSEDKEIYRHRKVVHSHSADSEKEFDLLGKTSSRRGFFVHLIRNNTDGFTTEIAMLNQIIMLQGFKQGNTVITLNMKMFENDDKEYTVLQIENAKLNIWKLYSTWDMFRDRTDRFSIGDISVSCIDDKIIIKHAGGI